ncbi:hypothetical protein AB0J80_35950 [Actinoplanes sp. NPDC049548]|uniref:hypothetical protein n=1 Tax=Actinoplanes sp. NPDC049548 TaxID=3155152 RepID=UPI00341669DE
MGNAHVSDWSLAEARKANEAGVVISDRAARQLAYAYSWSWASCWFEGSGDFAFPFDFNHAADEHTTPADYMDHCLFGWWMDREDGDSTESDQELRRAMRAYLEHRLATDGGVAVDGWRDWPRY